jgi:hypothetical protein
MNEPHFARRLRERAGVTDTDTVYDSLRMALTAPEENHEFIEFVMKTADQKDVWRVRLGDKRFYIIAAGTYPVTVYTQEQMRRQKDNRRRKKGR